MMTRTRWTHLLQIMSVVIMIEIARSSPWSISLAAVSTIADGRELMTRNLRSAHHDLERTTENNFVQDRASRRHPENQTTADEALSNLVFTQVTTPDTQRTFQLIPKEPKCVARREYAFILTTSQASDPAMLRFEGRHGEIRYYYCKPCSACKPGVRIVRPCTRRKDTLCSRSECINPDDFFDHSKEACFPSITSTPRPRSFMTSTPAMFVSGSGGDDIVDEVDPFCSTPSYGNTLPTVCLTAVVLVSVVIVVVSLTRKRRWEFLPNQEVSCNSTVHAVIDGPLMWGSSTIEMEVDLSQRLTITTPDLETLMKLSRNEESLHSMETNLNDHDGGDEFVNGAVSVLRGTSPYWLVMMGHFGPDGGVLSCEDSDVVLEIPPGAIPASRPHQFIKAKVSLTPDAAAPELTNDSDFLCLTPVVEFESPGLNKFSKDVLIRLPHKAHFTNDPSWTFRTHFTDPTPATTQNPTPRVGAFPSKGPLNCDPWYFVDWKNQMSTCMFGKRSKRRSESSRGVTCTVDERYFNISTPHFSKYACSGCHKNHPLHFEMVVYASHMKGKGYEVVKLIIYIMDPIKDHRRMVELEQSRTNTPRTRVSEYHPVILDYKKKSKEKHFLEITLMPDGMEDDWQWKLQYEDRLVAEQLITYQELIRCCSSLGPSLRTFDLEPKATTRGEPLSVFKAMLRFRQQQPASSQRELVNVVITLPLSDQCFGRELGNTRDRGKLATTIVTEDHFDVVLAKLLPKDWRPLLRTLMAKDVENEIQSIEARNPKDVREQKHDALLSWKRSHGRGATVDVLISALRKLDLTEIAESLEENNNIYPFKETSI